MIKSSASLHKNVCKQIRARYDSVFNTVLRIFTALALLFSGFIAPNGILVIGIILITFSILLIFLKREFIRSIKFLK